MAEEQKSKGWLWFGQPNVPKMEAPADAPKNLSSTILPIRLARIKQDTLSWREAVAEAERPFNPFRVRMQQMYVDTILNAHVKSCIERRKDLTILRDWQISTNKAIDDKTAEIINKPWFYKFISHSLDALFFGYSLIELGDVTDNIFKDLKVVKRWNVSPDRYVVSNMAYNLSGVPFKDEPWADWHVYVDTPNDIGTSDCGYGALYEVALCEIFLRNITGFNGDYVELFAQPIRVGRTNKIEEAERQTFADALAEMGSAGYMVLDAIGDSVEFVESNNAGTAWKSYENFEMRLQKLISKLLLGHADAMDSTEGKLGATQGKETPVYQALEDKQTKDGDFVANIINSELFPRLRKIGFQIPENAVFEFKNDHEIHENNERIADLSVKVKQAGLQVDADWFEQNTSIKVSRPEPVQLPPAVEPPKTIREKIQNIYKR